MAAGTVISGGFPGRVAQEVQPNQKCDGCLHFDGQAGRTGACLIGLHPWTCGTGEAPDVSYAPIARGAGSYLPDMNNHGACASQVADHAVGGLYGSGSTRPVEVRQVSLGEEHVHLVKSMLEQHTRLQKSQCLLCSMRGSHGVAPPNVGAQTCTCKPIEAIVIAKAITGKMTNAQRVGVSLDDLVEWVRAVAKAGFRLPVPKTARSLGGKATRYPEHDEERVKASLSDQIQIDDSGGHLRPMEKGSFYHSGNRYDVSATGGGKHHVDFHPGDGGPSQRLSGTFSSPKEARSALMAHAARLAGGSGKVSPTTTARTNPGRRVPAEADRSSGVPTAAVDKSDALDKSIYSEDWIAQFKGTALFDEAHKLCEQELAMEEAQLKRREARMKHDKARAAALDKLATPENSDWQEQDVKREKIRIAKQRLTLKLVGLQSK